jgi:iron donor protein CyaY
MAENIDFADDNSFRMAVKDVLNGLLNQIDEIDTDEHDPMLSAGNLKVVFESGGTFVLSQQPPTREIWLSANFTAWHFVRNNGQWLERDSDEPMVDVLSTLFSDKLEMNIRFHF